jgi:hypothetical protein
VLIGRVKHLRGGKICDTIIASRIIANYMADVIDEAELVSLSRQPLGR